MAKRKFGSTSGPPDPILLALISQFLSNHGFNSSLRIFNTERRKRPKKDGFQDTYGEKYTQDIPQLDELFRQHMQNRPAKSTETPNGTTQSSDNETSDEENAETESSTSSSESEAAAIKPVTKRVDSTKPEQKEESNESSSASSESESEKEQPSPNKILPARNVAAATSNTPSLKRKAPSSSESSEDSSEESSSSEDEPPATKKVKRETSQEGKGTQQPTGKPKIKTVDTETSDSGSDTSSDASSSEASSDSDSSAEAGEDGGLVQNAASVPKLSEAASDSSATITGETTSTLPSGEAVTQVKKHVGARPTRLAELSANVAGKGFVSNNYVSYAYADRAYNDLSVTRGKGFTKEKNKKKRGSYRGGTIDTSGGKGFRFED